MNKLTVLVGPSCSGKTTYAKRLIANSKENWYYISRDSERESVFGEYRMGSNKEEQFITAIVDMKIALFSRLGNIVLDNTHLNMEDLQVLYDSFKDNPSIKLQIAIMPQFSKEELLKRNMKRFWETGKLIPEKIIHRQMVAFQDMDFSLFKDCILKLTINV